MHKAWSNINKNRRCSNGHALIEPGDVVMHPAYFEAKRTAIPA